MAGSVRRPVVIAEATQQLDASDAANLASALASVGTVPTEAGPASGSRLVSRGTLASQSSIAPVGLDLAKGTVADTGEDEAAFEPPLATKRTPRKALGRGVVIGAIAACTLILLAAGVTRVSHASSESNASTASTGAPAVTAAATAPPAVPPATPLAPPQAAPVAAAAPAPTTLDATSAGTVRLAKPAVAGHVWLDGKKVTTPTLLVSCGTHQVKVGHNRKHSLDVPCGGEISLAR